MAGSEEILRGAYDLHVHIFPDLVQRSRDIVELAKEAAKVGMAGLGIKDHITCTLGRCFVLNRMVGGSPTFFSSLVLNPTVGGLNPCAVEAALRAGVDVIYFPTYGARNHLAKMRQRRPLTPFPLPKGKFGGIRVLDERGSIKGECKGILDIIGRFDGVLATGHLSPQESLELLKEGVRCGIKRMVVTHASHPIVRMDPEHQKEAATLGAFIEHSFFTLTESCPAPISLDILSEQIRYVGVEKVIVSSDFGQISNPPPVEGFAFYLQRLRQFGFSLEEIRVMTRENPMRLLSGRERLSF